jgi:DNA polymerase-3 subunit alpha
VAVNGKAPDIQRLVRDFPPRREMTEQGELVRGLVCAWHCGATPRQRNCSWVMIKFFPSDAALASWMAQADQGQAQIVYE